MREDAHIFNIHSFCLIVFKQLINRANILNPPKVLSAIRKSLRKRLQLIFWAGCETESEAIVRILVLC